MASRTLPARTSAVSCSIRPSRASITSSRPSASLRASAGDEAGEGIAAAAACAGRDWAGRFMANTSVVSSADFQGPFGRCGGLVAAAGLLQNERTIDLVGNSDAAGLGERFRILFGQHRAPHAGADAVRERAVTLPPRDHLRT